ncbi:MAG: hypothetical protein LUO88_00290 [Methanoregulaceae archaeon]|nr:hypothetical protein [Methanoregulaceae archaeon]
MDQIIHARGMDLRTKIADYPRVFGSCILAAGSLCRYLSWREVSREGVVSNHNGLIKLDLTRRKGVRHVMCPHQWIILQVNAGSSGSLRDIK